HAIGADVAFSVGRDAGLLGVDVADRAGANVDHEERYRAVGPDVAAEAITEDRLPRDCPVLGAHRRNQRAARDVADATRRGGFGASAPHPIIDLPQHVAATERSRIVDLQAKDAPTTGTGRANQHRVPTASVVSVGYGNRSVDVIAMF